jgi:recombination protein RecR
MAVLPEAITLLVSALSRFPGIGPRSAERIALYLAQSELAEVKSLAQTIISARERVSACQNCGALTEQQPCFICADPKRDGSILCVVERPVDIVSMEKPGTFHGRFHVLGGKISPINGVGPEDLRLAELEARLTREPFQELIMALPSDVEGDATCHYLAGLFAPRGVKVTRIAHGLPVGSGLEFADELTLSRALEGRRTFSP